MSVNKILDDIHSFLSKKDESIKVLNINNEICKFNLMIFDVDDGIKCSITKAYYHDDVIFDSIFASQNKIIFQFNLSNLMLYSALQNRELFKFNGGNLEIYGLNSGLKTKRFFAKNKEYFFVKIIFLKDTFLKYKGNLAYNEQDYFNMILSKNISNFQKIILQKIDTNLQNNLSNLYLKAKIFDLIYDVLEIYNTNLIENLDIDMIKKAKKIILNKYQNPPSIKQLAKLCATNESKLKKDFKAHYGVTIYEMILNQKMKIAKELLKNREISINEASNLVGYKNTSSFSRAFKESFGSSPMEYKNFIFKSL